MLSRIYIDLDNDNQPVIRIDYKPSEDVRDKMVKRFMETFAQESVFATFHFNNTTTDLSVKDSAILRPIHPHRLKEYKDFFNELSDKHDERVQESIKIP